MCCYFGSRYGPKRRKWKKAQYNYINYIYIHVYSIYIYIYTQCDIILYYIINFATPVLSVFVPSFLWPSQRFLACFQDEFTKKCVQSVMLHQITCTTRTKTRLHNRQPQCSWTVDDSWHRAFWTTSESGVNFGSYSVNSVAPSGSKWLQVQKCHV